MKLSLIGSTTLGVKVLRWTYRMNVDWTPLGTWMNVDEIVWMVGGSVEILCVGMPDISTLGVSARRFAAVLSSALCLASLCGKHWKKDRHEFVHLLRKVRNQRVWDEFRGEGAGVALAGQARRLTAAGVMEGPRRQGHPQNLAWRRCGQASWLQNPDREWPGHPRRSCQERLRLQFRQEGWWFGLVSPFRFFLHPFFLLLPRRSLVQATYEESDCSNRVSTYIEGFRLRRSHWLLK